MCVCMQTLSRAEILNRKTSQVLYFIKIIFISYNIIVPEYIYQHLNCSNQSVQDHKTESFLHYTLLKQNHFSHIINFLQVNFIQKLYQKCILIIQQLYTIVMQIYSNKVRVLRKFFSEICLIIKTLNSVVIIMGQTKLFCIISLSVDMYYFIWDRQMDMVILF